MTMTTPPSVSVRHSQLDADFWAFHRANPHVYDTLVRLAREAKANGRRKAGIGMLWEVLRWQYFLRTTTVDFKLNNNLRSRYARLIMRQESDLHGFFDVRSLS